MSLFWVARRSGVSAPHSLHSRIPRAYTLTADSADVPPGYLGRCGCARSSPTRSARAGSLLSSHSTASSCLSLSNDCTRLHARTQACARACKRTHGVLRRRVVSAYVGTQPSVAVHRQRLLLPYFIAHACFARLVHQPHAVHVASGTRCAGTASTTRGFTRRSTVRGPRCRTTYLSAAALWRWPPALAC